MLARRRKDLPEQPRRREGRLRSAWRTFRRATNRYRLLTDVVGGLLLVALAVGGLAAATGGVWPPIVVVESGSMMHPLPETEYGRFGTIDVGDIVFIRAVDGREDVTTWAQGGELRYGRPGDVIAYAPNGDRLNTTVIHRAIAYIEVGRGPTDRVEYRLYWVDGEVKTWGPEGIYFPELGFDESFGFTPRAGYKPAYSGFVTKGDNAFSNPATDQALGITKIVEPAWVVGRVYGEVPWLGLAKLALTSGQTNPAVPGWERVGNAFAPLELWSMFFLTLAAIVLVPLSIDTWRAWRALVAEREAEALLAEQNARRAREAQQAPPRRTTFAAIPRPPPPRAP